MVSRLNSTEFIVKIDAPSNRGPSKKTPPKEKKNPLFVRETITRIVYGYAHFAPILINFSHAHKSPIVGVSLLEAPKRNSKGFYIKIV